MEKIRIDVVGLAHWDVRDYWKDYALEAVGKRLTLQPQPENVIDPYAVRVREGSVHIGYVAVPDLDVIHQALKGCGKQLLKGVVVESNAEPPVLTVECEVKTIAWDYEPFDNSVYAGWHYDGLSLMPKKLEQLCDLTTDLIDELESEASPNWGPGSDVNPNLDSHSSDSTSTNLSPLIEALLESNLYDVSREMTRARYRIERLLSVIDEPKLKVLTARLRQQKGMLMTHDNREKVARYLFIDLPKTLQKKGLEDSHYTYDNRLNELKAQLMAFPYQLYDKFLCDPVDFLREVYYKHVPREYLFPLLSGIVLMILKGEVEIQRWGREGDIEPIGEIMRFGEDSVTSDIDRESVIRESLKELLEKKDAQGNLIIYRKNQWAGIMSVLVLEYRVTYCDMKAFCRKMGEWGFGEDSGYDAYCDYDSLSKCSEYATKVFSNWSGYGAKHQRMVKAATELRGILRPKIGRS